jgi:arylsulfatase A-like enzyme
MPTADRVAKNGLFYNQFHTTALCSPTRAALLTGRNHHSVATGVIQEMATGYPGYCGIIPKGCATFAELLKHAGYTSAWFGKNHNVPDNLTSPAGPFDNWPTSQGFDYFTDSFQVNGSVLSVSPTRQPLQSSLRSVPRRATSLAAISPTSAWAGFANRKPSRPPGHS